jgi:hypothetical protein
MHVSVTDYLRNVIKKNLIKNKKHTHIYGHTLFDTFGPLVSFEYFWSTKENINIARDHPMTIPIKFGSTSPSVFREEDWNVKSYGQQRHWIWQTPSDGNASRDPLNQVS